jgi:hypothetical protein
MSIDFSMERSGRLSLRRVARIVLPGLLAFVCAALAEDTATNKIKGFNVPEYYEPPHETQMKSLLQGTEAEPRPGGLILITNLKLQTFTEAGERQMTVKAPQCVFDSGPRTVSSSGRLQVQTGDEKLYLEGEGFFWQQTNSNLIISNRVRTTIQGALTNSFMQ